MIKIVTDSTCNLPPDLMQRYDIKVVPTNIQFGSETYEEGVTITRDTFYRKIEELGIMPASSQPSGGQFVEVYRELAGEGHSILSIHITSKLSGTCQSAELAKSMAPELDIEVFDSLSISMGTGFLVLAAARAAEEDKSMTEILDLLRGIRSRMNVFFTVATLKYLQMSGRVGRLQEALAALIKIKPIIKVEDGVLEAFQKVRTRRQSLGRLLELTEEAVGTSDPIRIAVIHAEAPEEAQALMEKVRTRFNCVETFVDDLSITLAVHGGPGLIGLIAYKV